MREAHLNFYERPQGIEPIERPQGIELLERAKRI